MSEQFDMLPAANNGVYSRNSLRYIITELEVRLEAREDELQRIAARVLPERAPKPSLLH